ncbi:DUF4956 domain-containing protein [Streptomyces sporangiiformans]|nr:DUF4956 domain-containing protein [Streptomyces sporangiiformans]
MDQFILVGADLAAISVLTFGVYFPRHHRRDLVTATPVTSPSTAAP